MSDENQNVLPDDGSPPGHIEKMLGRSASDDAQNTGDTGDNESQVAQRPADVPEKFWDAEKGEINTAALLKAQADAEAALRRGETPADDAANNDETPADDAENAGDQANVVEAASNEWLEKGELSEATFQSLEKVGLSRDMVNDYIAGQQAIVGNLQSAAYNPFEGKEGYDTAANWAAENLSDDEIQALDVQLTSNNPAIVAQGAKALAKVYNDNVDIEPNAIRGNNNGSTDGSVYRSRGEMMRDMSSPKYRTDAGFRQMVMEKLGRSKL